MRTTDPASCVRPVSAARDTRQRLVPVHKIDEEKRLVFGVAAQEVPDCKSAAKFDPGDPYLSHCNDIGSSCWNRFTIGVQIDPSQYANYAIDYIDDSDF